MHKISVMVEVSTYSDISIKKVYSENSIVNFSVQTGSLHFFVGGPLWILHFGCADGGIAFGSLLQC